MPPLPSIPVIAGPTAGGKSDLAVAVALEMGRVTGDVAEIITADAFQVYVGMDIGTAKPTLEERRGVVHHLVDIVEPTDRFTAYDWLGRANMLVADIRSRGRVPIVVGGTHLYIKAFLEGLFEGPTIEAAVHNAVAALSDEERRRELERVDPAAASRIHASDARRTIRAIEIFRQSGTPISEWQTQWDRDSSRRNDATLFCLDWPVETLNRRINARVKAMMERGLLDEVRSLHAGERFGPQSCEALGYKQLLAHLQGRERLDKAVEAIKIETRRFGKNQRTWLRRLAAVPGSTLLPAGDSPSTNLLDQVMATLRPRDA